MPDRVDRQFADDAEKRVDGVADAQVGVGRQGRAEIDGDVLVRVSAEKAPGRLLVDEDP